MSADIDIATRGEVTGDGTTFSARSKRRWLTLRSWLVLGAVVIILAVATVFVTNQAAPEDRLGADSSRPDGARAILKTVENQGVDVTSTTRLDEAMAGAGAPGSTLVIYDAEDILGDQTLDQIAVRAQASGTNVVLIDPGFTLLEKFAPEIALAKNSGAVDPSRARALDESLPAPVAADCAHPAAEAAGKISAGGRQLQTKSQGSDVAVCFPEPGQDVGADGQPSGSFASYTSDDRRISVIGNWSMLSNGFLADNGNAALALWLLGETDSLTYYEPSIADQPTNGTQPPSLGELLPDWVIPVFVWSFLLFIVTIFWRGRRFGALVSEPLPVVVRAAETVEGRARLYRRSGARERAALTLRAATMSRLARRLKLPRSSDPKDIVDAVVGKTGRTQQQVAAVLLYERPQDDTALQRLALDLQTLEREVQQP
ncbi:DUF4350 domain-containing protein [Saxibacter everestensis]|uniref:DUF4350 domain-containing protein n=1 Tax=Saxibacter everestensis TaxID=2909229 RepID=A0ABY8QP73_9MICO|nr:DUF4350 domain-containing protein [Brevibacteriaceae bacterium ZFBP1038]